MIITIQNNPCCKTNISPGMWLKMFPDFAGTKQNLEACEKNLKGAAKPPAKTTAKPKG